MAELNTQVILRNDLKANWDANSTVVLKAGEMGIETDTGKFKIGDETKTWAELGYAGGDEKAILNAIAAAEDKNTTKTIEGDATDEATLATIENPQQGDTAVLKRLITADKYSYTAYVYNGTGWEAMDGNYSADNVYFKEDITVTEKVGTITLTNGKGTLEAAGKNVKEVLMGLLVQERDPSATQPTVTLSSNNIGAKEVGTRVSIDYSFSTTAGSYEYGPATGITFSGYEATFNGETKTGVSGTFSEVQVTDTTNLTITGKCSSTQGAMPKTNLGNDYPKARIAAKSYTPSKGTLTGYRNWFFGYKNASNKIADPEAITSAQVRALTAKNGTIDPTISTNGMQQIFVCIPKGKNSSVKISNNVNGAPCTVTKAASDIMVEGANGYDAVAYTVWYVNSASADSGANTYKIVLG